MQERLFLKVVNGTPVDHPYLESNLIENVPGFNGDNPPEPFVPFQRIAPPIVKWYERILGNHYEIVNGIWGDVWDIEELTPEEKQAQIDTAKLQGTPFQSWTWSDAACAFVAPVPLPEDYLSKPYMWDEQNLRWVVRTPMPPAPVMIFDVTSEKWVMANPQS